MSVLAAATTAVISSAQLPPFGLNRQGRLSSGSVYFRFNPLQVNLTLEIATDRTHVPFSGIRNAVLKSTRGQSSVVCAAALNARCSAEQTQTITRKAPTMTHMPTKDKLPDLDDGGAGFPPRDDGDGGGGGGGGGGHFSGGFFLFGFLAFLGFLKDKEKER